ncbi:MAG TPA: sugar phosphate isomerase/epimerase [Rugosimonospora sp.]|nr:sugar phosphate isomerase/epimerase [Rugosimonospora sp.]
MSNPPSVGFNPLTWFFNQDGYHPELAPPLEEIYRQIKKSGFDAVFAEVPAGMGIADYRALLAEVGLEPAPGYFQASFADSTRLPGVVEAAKRVAAQQQELGLSRIFIAESFGAAPLRAQRPAIGAGFDQARLQSIAENLGVVAAAMTAEGVRPCLHQHIGTWIETPDELQFVLDNTSPDELLFGPDTGHLAWAGADPATVIAANLPRVGAVHLKDFHAAQAERAISASLPYASATIAGDGERVWTEPGNGDIDLDAVLRVLSGFDGWYVVEVDVADQPTPADTANVSAAWVREHLGGPA